MIFGLIIFFQTKEIHFPNIIVSYKNVSLIKKKEEKVMYPTYFNLSLNKKFDLENNNKIIYLIKQK